MPTYDYECTACGHAFELFQRMSDEPGAPCPECGADAERKISGGAGFLFKGDGFYITDYRSEEYKKKAAREMNDGKPAKTTDSAGTKKTQDSKSSTKDSNKPASESSKPSTKSSSDD